MNSPYSAEADFPTYEPTFLTIMDGFANETDQAILDTQPIRVDIVSNDRSRTFAEFAAQHPIPAGSDITTVDGLAILNGVEASTPIEAGTRWKVLVRSSSQ